MISVNLETITSNRQFIIYQSADGVILQNTNMEGFAHTHLHNLKTAEWLINLCLEKRLPRDIPRYLLISLLRISDNEEYTNKAYELLNNKKKKARYINRSR